MKNSNGQLDGIISQMMEIALKKDLIEQKRKEGGPECTFPKMQVV